MKQCFNGFLCFLEMKMNNWHVLMWWGILMMSNLTRERKILYSEQ